MSSGKEWQRHKIPKISVKKETDGATKRSASAIIKQLICKGIVTREQVSGASLLAKVPVNTASERDICDLIRQKWPSKVNKSMQQFLIPSANLDGQSGELTALQIFSIAETYRQAHQHTWESN